MKKGNLDYVMNALSEVSKNVLPLRAVREIRSWVRWLDVEISERNKIRDDFLAQYVPEGSTEITPDDENYEKAIKELNELFQEDLRGLPEPIDASVFPESLQLSPEIYINLEVLSVIRHTEESTEK
jgi:hypothetical protein